uniref:Predicted Carboxyl-terminal proteinase PA5134 n=1 Tax=uncultured bacterium BAC13K9BAC TaxID=332979 RepID=Q4JMX8_9BACT|nr:predicted Carboxyl-terminal proteinase PA5134 [uncultured bacterium BAC13K9BAC]
MLNKTLIYVAFFVTLGLASLPLHANDSEVPSEKIQQFVDVYKKIKDQYVDDVDDNTLFNYAIEGMVSKLDPYSDYLSKDDFSELKVGTTGRFGGIGIEITMEDDFVKIITPIDDTPAQRAGLKAGDLVIEVQDVSLKDKSLNDAVKLMRGEPGTKVRVKILREGTNQPLDFELTRQIIISKGIKTEIFNGAIGYLRLSSFQSNSSTNVRDAIYNLRKDTGKMMSALILDLRNNPGGVLGAAVGVSDLFLESGKIVYTKGRSNNSDLEYFANSEDILEGLPLYVLINGGSASASEIVAGALQDHQRAKIFGEKSFGKASVQSIQEMIDGSALKLTTARYYTPNDRNIHGNGIEPDVEIEFKEIDKPNGLLPDPYNKDNQIIAVIEDIESKISKAK